MLIFFPLNNCLLKFSPCAFWIAQYCTLYAWHHIISNKLKGIHACPLKTHSNWLHKVEIYYSKPMNWPVRYWFPHQTALSHLQWYNFSGLAWVASFLYQSILFQWIYFCLLVSKSEKQTGGCLSLSIYLFIYFFNHATYIFCMFGGKDKGSSQSPPCLYHLLFGVLLSDNKRCA